jgi:NAD(P)-dependent dehydrogenase (short-subunit alcohol dehydrogenase family)
MRFSGKAVIVTGGSKGIGDGCARVFCAEGGLVAILARGKPAGEALAAELSERGPGRAVYIPCDVAETRQLRDAIERAAAEFGRIDCLINNAGWHPPATKIDETRLEDLERLIRLNFISTFAGCQFALPHLRKTRGTIINMSSMVALLGQEPKRLPWSSAARGFASTRSCRATSIRP